MKDEIRKAIRLPLELENETFEMQGEAFELLENGQLDEALKKIWGAWNLLPEPKFNTSCSDTILIDLSEILLIAGKYEDAATILQEWINDLETCGYKIYETTPYILLGEVYLHLNKIEEAKKQFYKAIEYKATQRDFSDKPAFYFDIAKKKLVDELEIVKLFQQEVKSKKEKISPKELSEDIIERIEQLSEQGNEFSEQENHTEAIRVWEQALALIPNPQNNFGESLWLETSIGDAYYMLGDFGNALSHLQNAKSNIEENAYENPFTMLRLGQSCFEIQQIEEAKEYLLRAYMLEGEEIFEGEEKYLTFLKQHVKIE